MSAALSRRVLFSSEIVMNFSRRCWVLLGILAAPTLASASTSTSLDFVKDVTISSSNYKVYDLNITTDSAWTNERLDLSLTQGSIYQDTTFGGDGPPNPSFFAMVPSLQYDTFFTIPQSYPNISTQGTLPGFADNVETPTSLGVSWFAPTSVPANAPGTFTIAQIVMSSDAVGTYSGLAFDKSAPGVGSSYSGTIGAAPVPEPASLGLLAVGAAALLGRRKRA